MIVYLSGPMKGIDNYQDIFDGWENDLAQEHPDWVILNPAILLGEMQRRRHSAVGFGDRGISYRCD